MKTPKFLALALLSVSCITWKASAQKTVQPASIVIHQSYADNVPVYLRSRIDSTILATVNHFNTGFHALNVTVNDSSAEENIMLHITKGKRATRKQRNVAYLVNLIAPVYIPMHKIRSSIIFPKGYSGVDHIKPLKSSAHILIGNISKREDKLLQKYADKLLRELNHLDKQMSPELASIK